MLEVTEKAHEAIKKYMVENKIESALRVYPQNGCGGTQLVLGMDEAKESDHATESEGITFVLDKELSELVGGVKVDYINDGIREGLMISSEKPLPQAEGGCGCGCSC